MWISLIIGVVLGALAGGLLGRQLGFGCSTGSCPISSSPWMGILTGALVGGLAAMFIANRPTGGDMTAYEAIPEINSQQQFEQEVLKSSQPVLVDFSTTWCGWCKKLAPSIGTLSKEYSGKARFFRIDGDKMTSLVQTYKVDGYPTVLIFKPGQASPQVISGAQDIEQYRDALK